MITEEQIKQVVLDYQKEWQSKHPTKLLPFPGSRLYHDFVTGERQAIADAGVKSQLAALDVPDEELVNMLERMELTPRMYLGYRGAKNVLALILPILRARALKHEQEAVERERKAIAAELVTEFKDGCSAGEFANVFCCPKKVYELLASGQFLKLEVKS